MGVITLQGYIVVADGDLASVQEVLPEHIELTQEEDGCLEFKVSQDTEHVNRFNVYEKFVDRTAFEKHQKRIEESRWAKFLQMLNGTMKSTKVASFGSI